jgi:P4 family phage/plasmid primase-like protien
LSNQLKKTSPIHHKMADLGIFLEKYRIFKTTSGQDEEPKISDKPTVTNITGGSYYIPPENMDTFYTNYVKALNEGKKPTYLETPNRDLDYGVVKVDFDFRYPGDNGLKRMYSKDMIKSIATVYQDNIKKYFQCSDEDLTCFVTERTKPYKLEKEDKIRDGFHLFFNIGLPYSFQHVLRNIVIDNIIERGLIESVGTLNPVQDVVDKSVVETGNWFIYGSRKSNLEPYMLTMEIDHTGEELDVSRWKLIDLVKTFGIRKSISKQKYINAELEQEIKERAPIKVKTNCLTKQKKIALEKQISGSMTLPENCEHIKSLVNILSNERRDSYKSWFEVGACLYNIDARLLQVWIDFSKTSIKYEEGVCQKFWCNFEEKNLGIASLNYWAKLDNPQEFEKIRRNSIRYKLEQSIRTPSHFDIALVVHDMYKHQFVCVSPKFKSWYRFNGNHWEPSELGMCVRSVLSREVASEYLRYANECNQKIMQLNANDVDSESGNDNIVKALEEKVKSANKIASSLKTTTFKDNVVKEACELFLDSSFMEKLDNNLFLIGVQNGVIDLNKREFREGRPDDYVSKKCKINYIPCDMDDPEFCDKLKIVEDFFKKILPIENVRKYLLNRLASCLEGTNDQQFPILSGTGGNGKTILLEFMQEIFGEYACSISSTVFTQKSGSSSAASPEIARIRGVRLISAEETEEGSTINVAKMKEYTGGSKITPRKLFGDIEEFKPQAHWFLVCNNIPKITSDDGGTWRRILIVEFPSSFVDDPSDSIYDGNPYVFKKDETIGQQLYECREVFFSYLFHHYYVEFKKNGNREPPAEVKMATNSYRQENDLFFQYIKERIIKNPLSVLKISEVYGDFKYWFKESGIDAKIPSNKEFKTYFEKKFGPHGNHAARTAGWKGIAILPREIDLETPAGCEEKDL